MYIDDVYINPSEVFMALQIANPQVVSKVERLAKATGLSKTAVVERALDRLISETMRKPVGGNRLEALLAQLDRIPDQADAFDPMEWDQHGVPR
jgi:antitoxin VapB